MNFMHPIGFIALFLLIVLLIIYVIRNKYQERVVSSNYIWKLSEKFMRKRSKLSEINGLLSFLLQMLTILFLTFALARPIFSLKNNAQNYEFIIDGTASMNIVNESKTRFENAKEKITDIVNKASVGSTFSLIYAGENTSRVVSSTREKQIIKDELNKLEVTTLPISVTEAIKLAQNDFEEDTTLNIILFTDKDYDYLENINIENMSNNEENYALTSLNYVKVYDDTNAYKYDFVGSIASFDHNNTQKIDLYIDDILYASKDVSLNKDEEINFTFETTLTFFTKAEIKLSSDDALDLDNNCIIYFDDVQFESKVLLVSDSPFYLNNALLTLGNVKIEIMPTKDYRSQYGYDIYIFDSYSPYSLPKDGSIWFIGVKKNTPGAGFSIQEEVVLPEAHYLNYYNPVKTDDTIKKITKDTLGNNIAVGSYLKYSYTNSFTPILTCDSIPLLSVYTMPNSYKEVVFAFDFHKSDFPLKFDFLMIIRNLVSYSHLRGIDKTIYTCGDNFTIDKVPNTKNMKLLSPSDKSLYFKFEDEKNYAKVQVNEVGNYILSVQYENEVIEYNITVTYPYIESDPSKENSPELIIKGTKDDVIREGKYDSILPLVYIIIALAVLDWGVYLYEQHKLY